MVVIVTMRVVFWAGIKLSVMTLHGMSVMEPQSSTATPCSHHGHQLVFLY